MNLDYERDIQIDPDSLDVEWLDQAPLALRYGRHVAELRLKANKLEEQKKITRSELIQEANRNPEGCCDKEKPNAADIEAYYRNHRRYKEVVEELLNTQYELEFAEIAKNEITFTRKVALENLVKLHGQQYFAGPSVPRNLGNEWKRTQEQKRVDGKVKMKRRGEE